MDTEKLDTLSVYASKLAGWTDSLVHAIENPDHVPADRAGMTAYAWRDHCELMVGATRTLVGLAYNAIEEWQDI